MKNKREWLILTSLIVAVVMVFAVIAAPVEAFANAREDYEAAQAELNKIEAQLSSIKDTKLKQQQEQKNAQTQVNLVKGQINSLSAQIEETSEKLKEKQEELDEKKADIKETDELFKSKLKAMYIRRNGNMVATALAVDTFSEMLTAVNTLTNISIADTAMLEKLNREKKEIEKVEAEIEAELEALEESKALQESKQKQYADLLQKVNQQLSETAAQEAAAQIAYADAKQKRDDAASELEKEFAANGDLESFVGGTWKWPVPTNRYVSSHYGYRNIFGYKEFHTGIDIPAPRNTNIIASNSGFVTTATYSQSGYGNRVIIDHGGGYKTLYAHCNSLNVKVGDFVAQGDVIAFVGTTGLSTGNHLHFEIRQNGSTINPYPYIKDN